MRLVMLNWRYVDHPQAGGAEHTTHEILRRLVQAGHEVTCFTGAHDGAPPAGEVDGVRLIRRGRQWTVHAHAWRWLRTRLDDFDRVVDQINTIPFFTPLYVPAAQRRFFIHQLAREYWFRETRGPFKAIAPVGYAAEPQYLKLYRGSDGVVGSQSTADDLAALGIPRERMTVMPQPVPFRPDARLAPKDEPWRLVVVGRLTPAKFVEEAIDVFAAVQRRVPAARLDIAGSGDPAYRTRLEERVARDRLDGVTFHGRVDHERKRELLRAAHVHVFCSHREGWGLTVSEAAAVGTPSAGYDVAGVRDSVAEPRLLAPSGDTAALAARVLALHDDRALYERLRAQAWDRTKLQTYERTVREVARAWGVAVDAVPEPGWRAA